jgi:transposase
MADMALSRTSSSCGATPAVAKEVVPASDYRALQSQVCEVQRLLGKKALEALQEELEHATGSKEQLRLPPLPPTDGSR